MKFCLNHLTVFFKFKNCYYYDDDDEDDRGGDGDDFSNARISLTPTKIKPEEEPWLQSRPIKRGGAREKYIPLYLYIFSTKNSVCHDHGAKNKFRVPDF